jgi:drug/metabolite transporter (DMT)-like permease
VIPYLGELAALGTAVCWSFTPLFFGFSGRRVGSDVVNRSRLLIALALLVATHIVLFGRPLPTDAGPDRWGWLALSSILGLVIGDAALFQSYVLVGARLGTLMMSFVPIVSTAMAWIFLREQVGVTEIAGIALTVSGVAWVVTEAPAAGARARHEHYRRGLVLGLVGAAGQASNLIAARVGIAALPGGGAALPAFSASTIRILVAAAWLWGLSAARGDVPRVVGAWRDRRALGAIAGGAVVGPFLGISLSMVAIQHARIGVASTLMALPPVFLIPIEFILFRHRVSARGVVGTVLAFAGVAVILLVK